MVRRLNAKDASFVADFEALLFAKREIEEDVAQAVRGLIADVRQRGDTALVELTNKFDRANITSDTLKLSAGEIDAALGKVSKVELLGSNVELAFSQDDAGLTITPKAAVQPPAGITNQQLASTTRVLRITHDKGWINDDDPDITAPGWTRRCNLNTGDFNNDLTISDHPGDIWTCPFTGTTIAVIAPKESGAGKIEIKIDGESKATVDLATEGSRQPQQTVWQSAGLSTGRHTLQIINRGPGPVAIDAITLR